MIWSLMKYTWIFAFMIFLSSINALGQNIDKKAYMPVVDSNWWRICEMPDLGTLNGDDPERQHVIDHGFIQAENGMWQLWACMRGTAVGRLFFGWEGASLESGPWQPKGIVARAQEKYGEPVDPEKIQAPYFMKIDGKYYCFYNAAGIRWMESEDGLHYKRKVGKDGNNILYKEGGRDVMVIKIKDQFFAYSTVSTVAKDGWRYGYVIVRTSKDLKRWSDYTIVAHGGKAGGGPISAESPYVVELKGYFYLFRASSVDGKTYVYRSDNPYLFCNNDDENLIAELPIKAPELIHHNDQWYISDLADFQGIKLAKLKWVEDK